VNALALCIALWGLLYYLFYLFTGNSRYFGPLLVFYAVYYVLLIYYITASVPNNVEVGRWRAAVVYSQPLRGPFFVIIIALLLLPQVLGGLAYFTVFFRVTETTQRYRVLLVSWSIIIWFLSPLLALIGGVGETDAWQVLSRLIGLAAGLTILAAYLPPRWVKLRLGVLSIADESQYA
jgi:hypothetical protein